MRYIAAAKDMKPRFREDKATQAAAHFLRLRGGKMSHLKLMKLLYLAEREALLQLGQPLTFDSCVSMQHGPVLSTTLNLMHGEIEKTEHWDSTISSPENHEVSLKKDPGTDSLSEAEVKIIEEVFEKYGTMARWQLRDLTHSLGEWQDPGGSTIRIEYKEILRAGGKTESEIDAIVGEIEHIALMESHMGI